MREESIRQHTDNLINAFKTATGMTPLLTAQDFVLLRKAAIDEIRAGDIGEGAFVQKTDPASDVVQRPKNDVHKDTKKPASTENNKEETQNITRFPAQKDEDEESQSDLQILRAIADPWNS